ncbi:MAG: peptidylprolyl isomerase [Sulfuricurvum sp.]
MRPAILSTLLATHLFGATIGGVAVMVKDTPITMYEVQQEMKQSGTDAKQSADTLIRKKLEQLEAQEKKITVSSTEVHDEIARMAEQNHLTEEQFLNAMQTVRGLNETDLKAKVEENIKGQKLYSAIAFSKMAQPTPEEEAEYYQLHIDDFSQPESFDVTEYTSNSQEAIAAKIANPMQNIDSISSKDESLAFASIHPQLAQILNKTAVGKFSPILPNGQNGFVCFYIKEKNNVVTENLDSVRPQVSNAILSDKRNQVLNDYFTRLRLNADIKILRLPESE